MIYIHKMKHNHNTNVIKTWRFELVKSFSSDAIKTEITKVFTTSVADEFAMFFLFRFHYGNVLFHVCV